MRRIKNVSSSPLSISILEYKTTNIQNNSATRGTSFTLKPRGGYVDIKDEDWEISKPRLRPLVSKGLIVISYIEEEFVQTRFEIEEASNVDKVRVSNNDTTANYLGNKLVAGTDVSIDVVNPGGDEQLRIIANAFTSGSVTIDPSDTADVDSILISKSNTAKWLLNIVNATDDKSESSEMLARAKGTDVGCTKYAIVGDRMNIGNTVTSDGTNFKLSITNNESNPITVTYRRLSF